MAAGEGQGLDGDDEALPVGEYVPVGEGGSSGKKKKNKAKKQQGKDAKDFGVGRRYGWFTTLSHPILSYLYPLPSPAVRLWFTTLPYPAVRLLYCSVDIEDALPYFTPRYLYPLLLAYCIVVVVVVVVVAVVVVVVAVVVVVVVAVIVVVVVVVIGYD